MNFIKQFRLKESVKLLRFSVHDILLLIFSIFVIGYFISTLVIIPVISPDPQINIFPSTCPHPDNCTRIADTNNREPGVQPPTFNATLSQVKQAIKGWIGNQTILNESTYFFHIRWTQPLTRFRDDVFILLKPNPNNTQTTIWIQSQSRLGSYDFNTNTNRVNDFMQYLMAYKF